jgi:hypothetical protein
MLVAELESRDRNEASNFTAALDDYRQYLRRLKEAEQMRQQYSQAEEGSREERGQGTSSSSSSSTGPARDLSLKEPIKLTLNTMVSFRVRCLLEMICKQGCGVA